MYDTHTPSVMTVCHDDMRRQAVAAGPRVIMARTGTQELNVSIYVLTCMDVERMLLDGQCVTKA